MPAVRTFRSVVVWLLRITISLRIGIIVSEAEPFSLGAASFLIAARAAWRLPSLHRTRALAVDSDDVVEVAGYATCMTPRATPAGTSAYRAVPLPPEL